jgi:maltose alpha-D-glucosyltransferase/alpha-amylase
MATVERSLRAMEGPRPTFDDDDPLWFKDAIVYQAHVKSFLDSTGDGIGDFKGLTQKLDYLQNLGITCIWLLPFFPSPLRDDGYDIADYENVHPSYGTLDDFRAFVQAAHERRIRILIELVVNHTSDQHPWFERARRAPKGSPERAFYTWSDTDRAFPETRIIFIDTEKSNWTWDAVAGQYYWHRFFAHQPDLNHNNPAVVDAVIGVMKFWLDIGVDALRLDAVPYLCVREGTSNENLPETHEVLKRIRRELDASYRNRMLLAEANQWPADVRQYFGDGDECHMAYHFPLMPRMFMALRQEDRHPITEIVNQTPEIPENCQWALFLRNHDELTLEMVTDEERDYMYQTYAADPQMRLNLGIRRRLAPLIDNSRRRVELLNTLLFSLPGTPIVYYGDEIGMGDNIYLGDRNGVRTPMQWTPDRNGGFSRADPARLYAPPVMDPVYGYQAINVEAQERSPFSLLNWMRRLIAMRRQHRVFGRGSLDFVGCTNRKTLAFVRRHEDETILVVANLARTVQPTELDLAAFAGLLPVEMVGQTEFPRITDRPYFLTLGPHSCYWFVLQANPLSVTQIARPGEAVGPAAESLPSLLVGAQWDTILDRATRHVLERHALPAFLPRQRWFGAKSRSIREARFSDWTTIRSGQIPAFLTLVTVTFADGGTETYFIPLATWVREQAARALNETPGTVLARITGARKGVIVDGFADDDVAQRVVEMIGNEGRTVTAYGQLSGRGGREPLDLGTDVRWSRPSGDQSNSIAFLNDRVALKLYRRIESGPNPELEIAQVLARRGFARVPRLIGALEYARATGESAPLALAQTAITHQGSGWDFTVDELRRYYERVATRGAVPATPQRPPATGEEEHPSPFFAGVAGWYMTAAALLGRRTAEMHLALADDADPAFAPEAIGRHDMMAMCDAMQQHADDVLRMLEAQRAALPESVRAAAELVLASRTAIRDRYNALPTLEHGGARIRVHGDYHLGQVLRTEEDFVIIDFEGEPARTLAERRAKQTPMRDVAGMLRSFSYASYAALYALAVNAPDAFQQLEGWADAWQLWISRSFLHEYRATLGPSPLLPDGYDFDTLLQALVLDKGLYELSYELNNRPEWVRFPLIGILKLLAH